MWRYVRKRLILLIPVLLGAILIIFFIMSLCPGDPGSIIMGAGADQEAIDEINKKLGFYDPFFVRYFRYLGDLVQGDLGNSYQTNAPVLGELLKRAPVSLRTTFLALGTAVCFGLPLGVLTAVKQNCFLCDTIPTAVCMIFAAMPIFWLGMLLVYVFSIQMGLLPSFGVDSWKGLILPTFSLGLPHAARQMRYTRSSMLEAIREDYVRTARAKGCEERSVIWKHALKNALLPVVTVVGNSFGAMFGGTVIIERLFAIPGIGSYMVNGVNNRDIPVVTGSVITIALMYSLVTMFVDVLYAYIDPRTKARFIK